MRIPLVLSTTLLFTTITSSRDFNEIPTDPRPGDLLLEAHFERTTNLLAQRTSRRIDSAKNWQAEIPGLRRQLFEMLGLQPLPARSDLRPRITGTVERDGVIVEKLIFESRPGLYVTANFYRPAEQEGPLPTILYVCGHGKVKEGDISYGNKVHYQHHGAWFARNGYTCLTIDTLQLGEIEGRHHGTYRFGEWWWNARGYTPAGVEAWNGIRALDYLETRPEVDPDGIGVTGRSGGGAYTFWVAALDERVKVTAPVAGITSLQNHIVDGCIEGHCDCMFMVNTYQWDFPLVASLIAPRPLLILNTDRDRIFPLDGVVDVFRQTRVAYEKSGAVEALGFACSPGPHKDTQPLRVDAFQWFEQHLKGADLETELADTSAPKLFSKEELRVLTETPENERNTYIDEYFTRRVPRTLPLPEDAEDWESTEALIRNRLVSKCFRGWPARVPDLALKTVAEEAANGVALTHHTFTSETGWDLPLYFARREGLDPAELDLIVVNVLDQEGWDDFLSIYGSAFPDLFPVESLPESDTDAWNSEKRMHAAMKWGMLYLPPRGIGPTVWTDDATEQTHIRRRFALLGQTLDTLRVWDIRRGIAATRAISGLGETQLWMQSSGAMGGNVLYAALFEPGVHRIDWHDPVASHREGPTYLNILRFTDIPQIAAMVAAKT
ncbi:MAG: acetylxylan esterase, partial [Verrucomicrobiota bacterium]